MNKNPKEYWNILKSIKKKNNEQENIPEILKDKSADFPFFKSNIAFLISLYVIVESGSALYIMSSSIFFNWFSINFLKLELK
jgi:hypothetical protein